MDWEDISWDKITFDQMSAFSGRLHLLSYIAIKFLIFQSIRLISGKRSDVVGWSIICDILTYPAENNADKCVLQCFSEFEKLFLIDYLSYLLSDESHISASKKANFDLEFEALAASLKASLTEARA